MKKFTLGLTGVVLTIATVPASACALHGKSTMYFGKRDNLTPALEKKIEADIARTHTQVFDETDSTDRHVIFVRNNVLFLYGEPAEWNIGSFRYLGRGFYVLRGNIYFKGRFQGVYPEGASTQTSYTRQSSEPALGSFGCATTYVVNILQLSNGQRYTFEEAS
jgi:hypothetical protein